MKAKKFRKKLTFNKQTIVHLSNFEMNDALGGKNEDTVPVTFTCGISCTGLRCC